MSPFVPSKTALLPSNFQTRRDFLSKNGNRFFIYKSLLAPFPRDKLIDRPHDPVFVLICDGIRFNFSIFSNYIDGRRAIFFGAIGIFFLKLFFRKNDFFFGGRSAQCDAPTKFARFYLFFLSLRKLPNDSISYPFAD